MDLDELRQKRAADLQAQLADRQAEQETRVAMELQKDAVLKQLLTPAAKSRLTTLKLGNPLLAEQVEKLVIYLAQSGRVQKIDDATLKQLLSKISGEKREITIKRK
ncbi:MAG: DNA-binding protein [Candidatus Diapherotrites archaeon]|nr:DNA-binding protein [Candidatus Diapherotrites archaeon]